MDMPDASGDRASRTRFLSDLRNGAGTAECCHRRRQSGTAQHDSPLLDFGGAYLANPGPDDLGDVTGQASSGLARSASSRLGAVHAGYACGPLGWVAVLRQGLAI